jgi:Flp pilus assembly protein TadG
MFAQMAVVLRDLVVRLIRHSDGSLAPTFALALVPMVGAVGVAVDYSRANNVKAGLQATLDAAVLAAAKDGTSNWAQTALNIFNANLAAKGASVTTPTFTLNNGIYSGKATAAVPAEFLGIFKVSSINAGATSAASTGDDPDTSCILTLDHGKASSDVSLTFNGAPDVNLSGCAIRSNTSLSCNGHSGGATASIAAGTASGCTNPKSNAKVVPDIYAPLAGNITAKCGALTVGATWVPGTPPSPPALITVNQTGYIEYHICGDLTLSGNGYLTGSAPALDSVIIIENGSITIANNASINTVRTTIVLTGNNSYASSINFPNGNGHAATLSLSPPTGAGNPWQGVSLYQNPVLTNSVDDTWGPGATFNADGVVYLPNANVVIHGSSASNNAQCTKIVANSYTTNGSVNLSYKQTASGCTSLGMKQWAGNPPRLVQ